MGLQSALFVPEVHVVFLDSDGDSDSDPEYLAGNSFGFWVS